MIIVSKLDLIKQNLELKAQLRTINSRISGFITHRNNIQRENRELLEQYSELKSRYEKRGEDNGRLRKEIRELKDKKMNIIDRLKFLFNL